MLINAQTRFCFLLGSPVKHSLSPLIHNSAFRELNLNYVYLAAHVGKEQVGAAVKSLRALSAAGANVTSPYKEAVIPYLDTVSAEAEMIKSVNTIVNKDGILYGTTTDGSGFFQSLKYQAPDYSFAQPVMIIGAGGAARAVAYTLARSGVEEMYIVNRSIDRAEDLAALIGKETKAGSCTALPLEADKLKGMLKSCRLFVYALPEDNEKFMAALAKSSLTFSKSIFYDLRYRPQKSEVMECFSRSGGRAFNGLGMLMWQAVFAFEHFTGQKAPVKAMQKAVKL